MEERLNRIFSNINEWLKFAEAKHAVIIGLNGVGIWALLRPTSNLFSTDISGEVKILVFGFTCSLILSLLSFFPRTAVPYHWLFRQNGINDTDNLLFYNDIKKYNSAIYLEKLCESINKPKHNSTKLEAQYAEQIIFNSKITSYKYFMFKLSLLTDIIAILVVIMMLLLL